MDDCIFCKIVIGEIPAQVIFESDNFIVIKDIKPKTDGHSLIIPKNHYRTLLDMEFSLYGEFLECAKETALKFMNENKAEGFNLIMNNFKVAGQLVEHAHLHVIPRYKTDNFRTSV